MSAAASSRRWQQCLWSLLAGGSLALPAVGAAAEATANAASEPAPALVAQLFDGSRFTLAEQRGHVVVVNFWASWCSPCRAEMPALEALQKQDRGRGLIVIGLSADDRHDRAAAIKAAGTLDYRLGMLSDAPTNGFGEPRFLPLTYVIGRDGRIAAVVRGGEAGTLDKLHQVVEAALATAS